jgi:hypothetical protein
MRNSACSAVTDFRPPHLSAVCAYCKRVRTAAGVWQEHEPGCLDETEHLTHSACPSCYGIAVIALLEEIREEIGLKGGRCHDGH